MFRKLIRKLLSREHRGQIGMELEKSLEYDFRDRDLLFQALIHRSCTRGEGKFLGNYERLEFLGDSVLNMVVTHHLYGAHPDLDEGDLSKMKSVVVSAPALAQCAAGIALGGFVQMSDAEKKAGGEFRQNILADAFEAVIGAMYLDGGIQPCRKLLHCLLVPKIAELIVQTDLVNYKSLFLEYAQARALGAPEYRQLSEEGPEHAKIFSMQAMLAGKDLGSGSGISKKAAEQVAAARSLELLQNDDDA